MLLDIHFNCVLRKDDSVAFVNSKDPDEPVHGAVESASIHSLKAIDSVTSERSS